MPLLWNMAKAFLIRHQLLTSIPEGARASFSVIMDPASGTVSVTIKHLSLDASNLLRCERYPRENMPLMQRGVLSGIPFFTGRIDVDARVAAARDLIERKQFAVYNSHLLRATWMALLNTQMSVKQTAIMARRFTVDFAMSIEPALLEVKWPTFVYLALALGVDAYDGGLHQIITTLSNQNPTPYLRLKDNCGRALMNIWGADERVFASLVPGLRDLYLRRALAWELIMVLVDQDGPQCIPVINLEQFPPSDIVAFTPKGITIATQSLGDQRPLLTYSQRELSRCSNLLETALTWVLYTELVYAETGEILPASQALLNLRLKILDELEEHIATASDCLRTLFPGTPSIIEAVQEALHACWTEPEFQAYKQRRTEVYRMYIGLFAVSHPPDRTQLCEIRKGFEPESYFNSSKRLNDNVSYKILIAAFNPLPRLRTGSGADLNDIQSPLALLARIVLATSIVQFWPCIRVRANDCIDEADPSNPLGRIFRVDLESNDDVGAAIYLR